MGRAASRWLKSSQRAREIEAWLEANRELWPKQTHHFSTIDYKPLVDKAIAEGVWGGKTNRTTIRGHIEGVLLKDKINHQIGGRRVGGSSPANQRNI